MGTYYFVTGACGSLALYYKSGQPKAARVILSPEQVAAAQADGTDPQLAAIMFLSDAFGAARARERAGQLLDDGAPPPQLARRYEGRGERMRRLTGQSTHCFFCSRDPCVCEDSDS